MNAADEGRIPSPILDEAAEWLVRLQDSGCTDDTRQACAQWRQRSPQHAHAWERAERLLQCLGRLPPALALPTLGRERGLDRRRAIKHLALVLGGASLGLATWQAEPLRDWLADQRTGVGEQRRLTLPDGSLLTLNTDSAVDLAFDGLPDAWTRGMLMADRMPLAEVLAELARYRRGVLRCDPQLARLAVSGAYPLLDLRRTLGMLQATYPLKVRGVTDYWISLVPA